MNKPQQARAVAPGNHARTRVVLLSVALLIASTAHERSAWSGAAAPLPPIVFVSRGPVLDDAGRPDPTAIPGIGPRDRTAAVGGRLMLRDARGKLRTLVGSPQFFDAADPCVSWDGKRILFSGLRTRNGSWRIFEVGADGRGVRALTRDDRDVPLGQFGAAARRFVRYDDVDPCWLPDGRIAFSSTRYPSLCESGEYLTTNLFVIGPEGGRPRRVTSERSGGEEPAVDPITGRIVYSRWWFNLDRPSHLTPTGLAYDDALSLIREVGNLWQTVSITPDGRGTRLHGGDPRSKAGLQGYKPALRADGRVLSLFAANSSLAPSPAATTVRCFSPGASAATWLLTPCGPTGEFVGMDSEGGEQAAPRAVDPIALPDGGVLLSYDPSGAGDFGIYRVGSNGTGLASVVDLPGTHELDAVILAAAPIPPVIPDELGSAPPELPPTEHPESWLDGGTFRFDCLNVFTNAPVDAPIPDAPPITRGARLRFFLNFQRQNPNGRDPSILFREAHVTPRGAVFENGIPAEIPLFDQLSDAHGKVLIGSRGEPAQLPGYGSGRHGGWAQCVGCHAGHSVQEIPHSFAEAEWFNCSTSAKVEASSEWHPDANRASPFPAARVVDRRAREDSLEVAWVAAARAGQWVTLRWSIPVEMRSLRLYGVRRDPTRGTDLSVGDCRIILLRGVRQVGVIAGTGPVMPEGTEVNFPPLVVDAIRIELLDVSGQIRGAPRAGLAEVETIARLALD